jgi:hypothetical protein
MPSNVTYPVPPAAGSRYCNIYYNCCLSFHFPLLSLYMSIVIYEISSTVEVQVNRVVKVVPRRDRVGDIEWLSQKYCRWRRKIINR